MSATDIAAKPKQGGLLVWVQRLWLAVVALFIAGAAATQWSHLAGYEWRPSIPLLVVALGFAVVRKFWGGVLWAFLMATFARIPLGARFAENLEIYFLTNLASYVPGSLWYIPWRMKLYRERGVSLAHTSVGSAVESLILVVANGVLGLPVLGALFRDQPSVDPRIVVAMLLLGALALQPPLLRFLFRLFKRLVGRDITEPRFTYGQILIAVGLAFVAALTAGGSVFFMVKSLDASLTLDQYFSLTCSFSLAWVIGFLTPIAPGGLGVREGLLVWLLRSRMPLPVATAAALATRLIFIFEDLFWAGVAVSWRRLSRARA